MAKRILISVILFLILDFLYYLFQKYILKKDYKNYLSYIKRSCG